MKTRAAFCFSVDLDPAVRGAWRSAMGGVLPRLEGVPAELRGMDLIFNGVSAAWDGRVAALRPGAEGVPGVLFQVPRVAWSDFEAFERTQDAFPVTVRVSAGGQEHEATAFVPRATKGPESALISERALASMLKGLLAAKVAGPAVDRLQAEAMIVEAVQRVQRQALAGATR